MPISAAGYAAQLYGTLHQLDREQIDWIAIERPNDTSEWEAVVDRLLRSSTPGTDAPR
jgi:hypothetical protein